MRVAGGEGGRRGLCNAGSHVCSLPGCAAGRRPGLPRSRAASRGWAARAPSAPGRPGKGLGRGGDFSGQASRLAPAGLRAGAVGVRRGGCRPPRGARSPLARPGGLGGRGLARAERGRGERGGGGGATAAPPEAKFEKRTRFPPFFKPKNKTFSPISFAPLSSSGPSPLPVSRDAPRSAQASRGGGGDGFAFTPRRGSGARGPCPESGPSVWAGCGSSRQPGRATVRRSAMLAGARLPPLRTPACGFEPLLPGPDRGLFCARFAGARLVLAGAARSCRRRLLRLDSSGSTPRGRAAVPLPRS